MDLRNKAARLSDPTIHELSLVFAKKDGVEWGPRNPESRATVKAAAVSEKDARKGFVGELIDKLKSWYTDGPVVTDTGNSDEAGEDYNAIVALITTMNYDLQSACWIGQDEGRSAAVVAIIDGFLKQLDELRAPEADDTGKAGARHSAADKASIAAIADAHAKLGKAIEAASKAHGAIGDGVAQLGASSTDPATPADGEADKAAAIQKARDVVAAAIAAKKAAHAVKAGDVGEDGLPVNYAELVSANGASNGGQ
jgi:hypothetical protein